MTFRKSILLLIALGMIAALVACSSSSETPPAITVALSPAPPASLATNAQASLTAVVTNDSASAGVHWTATCGSADCGKFSSTTTPSGTATTYTAPAAVPTGNTVTVKATSVTDATKSASANITITAPLADGNYVFSLSGWDFADVSLYSVAGVFTVASGAITGGEQDFVDFDFWGIDDLINPTGSSVTTTADGNLKIVLTTCFGSDCTTTDNILGVSGVETLNGSVLPLNPNKALITEFDASATASGELDLQDATAAAATPALGYAFGLNGFDPSGFGISMGGVINVDGAGTISGTGSIFDANDDFSGSTFQAETFAASTVSAPDALGRVTFTLNPTDSANFPQIVLVGYIVDANKIRLVETVDTYFGTIGGTAFSQGTNTGTFSDASVSGNSYVVGLNGFDTLIFILQAAGQFTFNADGTVSGFINYNDLSGVGPQAPSPLTGGTYAADAGTGRVTMTGVTDGIVAFNAEIYLDGNGRLLAATMDTTDALGGVGFQQSGVGAFTAGSFSGAYAMGATGADVNLDGPFDAVGTVTADGVGAFAGFTDLNWLNFASGPISFPDLTVSGTFTADPSGVFTDGVKGLDVTTATNSDVFNYYLIDATGDSITIETDTNQLTLGYLVQQ